MKRAVIMKRKRKDIKHPLGASPPTAISSFHKTCKLSDLVKVCPHDQHISKVYEDEGTVYLRSFYSIKNLKTMSISDLLRCEDTM